MFPSDISRRLSACLLLITALAGPVGCSPKVTQFEIKSAQASVDEARRNLAIHQQELDNLKAEEKALKTFGGPEHQQKLTAAMALREEKEELEEVKTKLDSRLAHFAAEAQRYRDALAKEKQL